MAVGSAETILCSFGRNLGFHTGMLLVTLVTIILSPIIYLLHCRFRRDNPGQAVRRIIWYYGRCWVVLTSLFVPLTVRTGSRADYPSPCIVVANHQSFFDAFCMGALPLHDFVFVVRAWPFRIPFYGPYMRRAEYLNSEVMTHDQFLVAGAELLRRGTSLIIFPEGTRSTTGALGRFYSGAFRLATATGTPVVPLCLGGLGSFLPRGSFLIRRYPVVVETLPAVDPADFTEYGVTAHMELRKAIKTRMTRWCMMANSCTAPEVSPVQNI